MIQKHIHVPDNSIQSDTLDKELKGKPQLPAGAFLFRMNTLPIKRLK
jgi:hypothetical protein